MLKVEKSVTWLPLRRQYGVCWRCEVFLVPTWTILRVPFCIHLSVNALCALIFIKGLLEKYAICDTPLLYKIAAQETENSALHELASVFSLQLTVLCVSSRKTEDLRRMTQQRSAPTGTQPAWRSANKMPAGAWAPPSHLNPAAKGGVAEICRCSRYRRGGCLKDEMTRAHAAHAHCLCHGYIYIYIVPVGI